jgi:aerobic C4-dicarboxylate transport protein
MGLSTRQSPVERFMSEIRAVTNLFSNIFATIVISKWMGELKDEQLHLVLDGGPQNLSIVEPELVSQAPA